MALPEITVELEVPFHDVDALHVVWHGHYYKYLEIARTELMRSRNLDNMEIVALGHRLLMMETRCRHVQPLRYGDRFSVRARFLDYEQRLNIGYEVKNLTAGVRAARGRTTLVSTDADGRLLLETPLAIRERIHG